jgi:MFS family permease
MAFPVSDTLTEEQIESGLKTITRDGMSSTAMITFTGGALLVAFALKLGASNLVIGLLAATPTLMQLLQLPSIYLVDRIRNRRAITVYALMISRSMWLMIALAALFLPPKAGLPVLVICIVVNAAFSAVVTCAWNSWMRDFVPEDRLGSFYSRRMRLSAGLGIILYLAIGAFIDLVKRQYPSHEIQGYAFLFILGFLVGYMGIRTVSRIPEPRMADRAGVLNLFSLISIPFKNPDFRKLLIFMGSWSFAVNLAAPFFTVYMLKRLHMSLTFIIGLTVLSQIMHMLFLKIWGRYTDRFSNKSVLSICGPLFLICILAWAFTTMPEKYAGTIPLLIIMHIVMGASMAGVTLSTGNIAWKVAPKEQSAAYLVANSIVTSLTASIGPILGGLYADFYAKRELSITIQWVSPVRELAFNTLNFQHWDFFFATAFVLGLFSLHWLTKVRETGEVEEKIVIQELISEFRRPMRNLSSTTGLREFAAMPFAFLRHIPGVYK